MRRIEPNRLTVSAAVLAGIVLLAMSDSAFAFRCGSRVVQDGMHEVEVIRLCGEPISVRHLGYVVRSFSYGSRSLLPRHRDYPGRYGHYLQEVEVTEMVFNFGPRKLMRKLRFEGGILRSIRTMGYGFIDNDKE